MLININITILISHPLQKKQPPPKSFKVLNRLPHTHIPTIFPLLSPTTVEHFGLFRAKESVSQKSNPRSAFKRGAGLAPGNWRSLRGFGLSPTDPPQRLQRDPNPDLRLALCPGSPGVVPPPRGRPQMQRHAAPSWARCNWPQVPDGRLWGRTG